MEEKQRSNKSGFGAADPGRSKATTFIATTRAEYRRAYADEPALKVRLDMTQLNPRYCLVAKSIEANPELKDNPTFWRFVERCADAIKLLNDASHPYEFFTSYSGSSLSHNNVTLAPKGADFCIHFGDDNELLVVERFLRRTTPVQLVAFLREWIAAKRSTS